MHIPGNWSFRLGGVDNNTCTSSVTVVSSSESTPCEEGINLAIFTGKYRVETMDHREYGQKEEYKTITLGTVLKQSLRNNYIFT